MSPNKPKHSKTSQNKPKEDLNRSKANQKGPKTNQNIKIKSKWPNMRPQLPKNNPKRGKITKNQQMGTYTDPKLPKTR